MVTQAATSADEGLSRLLAGPVRLGYECVPPPQPAPSPERLNPPLPVPVPMIPRAKAVGLGRLAAVQGSAALVVWIVDLQLGTFSLGGAKGFDAVLVVVVNLAAAAVGFWGAKVWLRSRPQAGSTSLDTPAGANILGAVNAFATLLFPYLVLPVEACIAAVLASGRGQLIPDPSQIERCESEHRAAVQAWQQRIVDFEAAELRRVQDADLWFPVALPRNARLVCVFGGSAISWSALLTTVGATLLGAQVRVLIGDLSRRHTTEVLADVCRAANNPAHQTVLSRAQDDAGLFTGMTWNDLSTVLVEVLHSAQLDPDVSRRERQEDRAVIREIADCLDPAGPVSISRLRAAMLVVEAADDTATASLTSAPEYDRLTRLFNEVQRQHGGVLERVTRIERALRSLDVIGPTQPVRSELPGRAAGIEIVSVDKSADELDNEQFVDLLFQLLLRRMRVQGSAADVLILLGADRIRRPALESLISYAERERVGVLLFFEHLREDAVEVVGAGGAAAGFFALGNHREAREASEFIGAGYKWVESQHTRSEGRSLTQNWGEEESVSTSVTRGFKSGSSRSISESRGHSYGEAFGSTKEYSVGESRVREAILDPEVLMGLPPTGLICVHVLPGGGRVTANVDCHPQLAFAPRVSGEPRALVPAG